MVERFVQAPSENLPYIVDWSEWLPGGDTIAASMFTADVGVTVGVTSFTQAAATVWISGGVAGCSYDVVNVVTTAQGLTGARTLKVEIETL